MVAFARDVPPPSARTPWGFAAVYWLSGFVWGGLVFEWARTLVRVAGAVLR